MTEASDEEGCGGCSCDYGCGPNCPCERGIGSCEEGCECCREDETCIVCGMELERRGNWLICPAPNCPWHNMIQIARPVPSQNPARENVLPADEQRSAVKAGP